MCSSGVICWSSVNLLVLTQVFSALSHSMKYNEHFADKGKNISITCETNGSVMWLKESSSNNKTIITTGNLLIINNVTEKDGGVYVCLTNAPYVDTNNFNSSDPEIEYFNKSSDSYKDDFVFKYVFENDVLESFREHERIDLTIRTPPGPVSQLYFKASTILGFLIWRFNRSENGGYAIKSFTAEYRPIVPASNETRENDTEVEWIRLDPTNIAPNVRQMEVYKLAPNSSYEFRIWANNALGAGDIVTTNVTTLPETSEDDLVRLIQIELDKFDPRWWMLAVAIVLGTLVILTVGLIIVYCKEAREEEANDNMELIANIFMNPGFDEKDREKHTIYFDDDREEALARFKRRVSVFFTGPTMMKRI